MKETDIKNNYFDNLICPYCHDKLIEKNGDLSCLKCKKDYKIIDGIPNFNLKDEYWSNVRREKMVQLNKKAKESGDWLAAAKEMIPEYLGHIEPFERGDAQYLLPFTNDSRVLDAGSMWGGLTIPIAQHCKEIYAIDKTVETLEFLKIRAKQMGFENVHVVSSPLRNLPFPDDFFDLIILNGVLEWVAFDQPVILEEHWGKKRTDSAMYSKDPRTMQVEVLRELRRIIKPGGYIFVAIENSIGYQYLAGFPDDHVNLKYVSFLPRFVANAITKWKLNCEYRTYTYSLPGYSSLLKDSDFNDLIFYGAFPHYISASEIIPVDMISDWKEKVLPINSPLAPNYAKILGKLFPKWLLKHVSPSFMILGRKGDNLYSQEARIIQLLVKANLIDNSLSSNTRIIKTGSRGDNYHSVNFLIYEGIHKKPKFFCKICRNEKYTDILKIEAENLSLINKTVSNKELAQCIPELLYFGRIDGITFEVMSFLDGEKSKFGPHSPITKNNLEYLDSSIRAGIDFLSKFQKITTIKTVNADTFILSNIEKQKNILAGKGKLTEKVDLLISKLIEEVKSFKGLTIPICAVHGDYDFYYNILIDNNKAKVVDFEHFEAQGMPFLDLATLILHPILMNERFLESDSDIKSFIDKYYLRNYMTKWLNLYSDLSGISPKIIKLFGKLAALEQQTKDYPYFRDPQTFPMYKETIFEELLSLEIVLEEK